MERVLNIRRTDRPVLSDLRRSVKFEMTESSVSNGPDGGIKKCQLLARVSTMNLQAPAFFDNEEPK